ncbi:MAG TPA: HAMP domain-containing histidine kinase [Verrucomicrobiales bacterium]|nr:HAMP domain-containing histidine kinase [Verrucomicrobiales bacterium]HIL68687.1 HAMP domain-containing histidine kinase [Verrucomicrobiota bacterium]
MRKSIVRKLLKQRRKVNQYKQETRMLQEKMIEKDRLRVRELDEKNKEMTRSNEEDLTLLRVLTHDINNQLMVISASVDEHTLEDINTGQNPELDDTLKLIRRSSSRVIEITQSVTRMRQIDEGKYPMKFVDFKLNRLPGFVHETFDHLFKKKRIHLKIVPEVIPESWSLKVDATLFLHTVINNLVSNALKFSNPESTIWVEITREDSMIQIDIKDQGIGIPEDLCALIFRSDVPTTRQGTHGESGTGFGMPLVKKFIEAMGGTIRISSRSQDDFPEAHGTTVTLLFHGSQK